MLRSFITLKQKIDILRTTGWSTPLKINTATVKEKVKLSRYTP
jgi:hypothetical protein